MPSAAPLNATCHGRVVEDDFERMVPAQWWKHVFADAYYLKTDGDVVEDPEITKEELKMLESNPKILKLFECGLSERPTQDSPKVLDLCCGQGRHTLLLAERYPNLRLHGHDQSAYLISLARERATHLPKAPHRATIPQFTIGDCRSVPYETEEIDFVMVMGNSFGYFSANDVRADAEEAGFPRDGLAGCADEGDREVLREINRVLKTGGHMVLDLADGDYMRQNFSPRSWEWIDDQTFVCRERVLSKDKKRLHSREVIVATNRGVVRDQFYSERLYGREELVALLHEAGFDIEAEEHCMEQLGNAQYQDFVPEGVNTVTAARELSQRGQDLGMMEQRLLIFAHKVRDHPFANKRTVMRQEDRVVQKPYPYVSPESAQIVREWIERISPQEALPVDADFTPDYTQAVKQWIEGFNHASSSASTKSVLREWIDSVILAPKSQFNLALANGSILATPSLYHLLPPPPFPAHKITVLVGDSTISCRDKLNGQWNLEDLETRKKMVDALLEAGYDMSQIQVVENHKDLVKWLATRPPHFVFNLCDEGFYNDAHKELHVPAIMEMCGVNYSGAAPLCLGICYDKGFVNSTAAKMNIPVPRETYIMLPESIEPSDISLEDIDRLIVGRERSGDLMYPAFVKPMQGDNSLGITGRSIVHTRQDLAEYILSLVHEHKLKQFIVQEYLTGTEYSVGMFGNPETGFHFLPILQVDYSRIVQEGLEPILGWESKWDPESPYWTEVDFFPAKRIPSNQAASKIAAEPQSQRQFMTGGLTEEEEEELKRWCTVLFERFGCRDYARFDWRADKEIFYDPETGEMRPFRHAASSVPAASPEVVVQVGDQNSTTNSSDESSNSRYPSDSGHGSSALASDTIPLDGSQQLSFRSKLRRLKLLEVNPNPGWCWDGKLAKMAAFEGVSYPNLVKSILWAAWERCYGHPNGDGRQLLTEWCTGSLPEELLVNSGLIQSVAASSTK